MQHQKHNSMQFMTHSKSIRKSCVPVATSDCGLGRRLGRSLESCDRCECVLWLFFQRKNLGMWCRCDWDAERWCTAALLFISSAGWVSTEGSCRISNSCSCSSMVGLNLPLPGWFSCCWVTLEDLWRYGSWKWHASSVTVLRIHNNLSKNVYR